LAAIGTLENEGVYYQLTADINLDVAPYNTGAGWTPVGFRGNFDGNNHKVIGLYINNSSRDYVGLFGSINGGTVQNLTVEGEVSGHDYVGGVAGRVFDGGSISNCISAVKVISSGVGCGGVVGIVNGSSVANCYATGAVSGTNIVGGIAGQLTRMVSLITYSTITNCYATGAVSGNYNIGGVVGSLNDYSRMTNCYATGAVSGINYVGGVVGGMSYNVSSNPSVTNCAALNPSVKPTSGEETGFYRVAGTRSGSYNVAWEGMTVIDNSIESNDWSSIHGADISTAEAKMQDIYETMGWQFGTTDDDSPWKMGVGGYLLPVFWWQTTAPAAMPEHLR